MDVGLIECRPSESDLCGGKVNKLCAEKASGPNHSAPPFKLTNYFLNTSRECERKTEWLWIYCILRLFTAGVLGMAIFETPICILFPIIKAATVSQTDFPQPAKRGKIKKGEEMLMNWQVSQLKGCLETAMLITFLHLLIYPSGLFLFKNVGSQQETWSTLEWPL